jgi:hypothetical protein|tara:strand:- start:63 stop:9677 length:9615 start_codon:yes stop_codon:yes gene_type:complete
MIPVDEQKTEPKIEPLSQQEIADARFNVDGKEFNISTIAEAAEGEELTIENFLLKYKDKITTTSRIGDFLGLQKGISHFKYEKVNEDVFNTAIATASSSLSLDKIEKNVKRLAKQYEARYGRYGFEFKPDTHHNSFSTINVVAPNKETMQISTNTSQEVVAKFINENQDLETSKEIVRLRNKIHTDFTSKARDKIISAAAELGYGTKSFKPFTWLYENQNKKGIADIFNDVKRDIVDEYGVELLGEKGDLNMFQDWWGGDILEQDGLSEYQQDKVWNHAIQTLVDKETDSHKLEQLEAYVKRKRDPEDFDEDIQILEDAAYGSITDPDLKSVALLNRDILRWTKERKGIRDKSSKEYIELTKKIDDAQVLVNDYGTVLTDKSHAFFIDLTTGRKYNPDLNTEEDLKSDNFVNVAEDYKLEASLIAELWSTEEGPVDHEKLKVAHEMFMIGEEDYMKYLRNTKVNTTYHTSIGKEGNLINLIKISEGIDGFNIRNSETGEILTSEDIIQPTNKYDKVQIRGVKSITGTVELENAPLLYLQGFSLQGEKRITKPGKTALQPTLGAEFSEKDELGWEFVPGSKTFMGEPITDDNKVNAFISARQSYSSILARKEAWQDIYLCNLNPGSIEKPNWMLAAQGITDHFGGEYTKNYLGNTDMNRLTNMESLLTDVNEFLALSNTPAIKLSESQKENFQMSFWEDFSYAAGSFVPMIGEFAFLGAATGGILKGARLLSYFEKFRNVLYVTERVKKSKRFLEKTKLARGLTEKAVKTAAKEAGVSLDVYLKRKGLVKLTGGTLDKLKFHGFYALVEEGKMQLMDPLFGVDMPTGTGLGFYAGGTAFRSLVPWRMKGATGAALNPFLEKNLLGGVGGMVAAQVATPLEAVFSDMMDNEDFKTFWEENYFDEDGNFAYRKVGRKALQDLLLFGALGFTHMKPADLKFTIKGKQDLMAESSALGMEALTRGDKQEAAKHFEIANECTRQLDVLNETYKYQDINLLCRDTERIFERFNKRYAEQHNGEVAFEATIQKSRKGLEKGEDAKVIPGVKGKPTRVIVDARKLKAGTLPHEIFHVIMIKRLLADPQLATKLKHQIQGEVEKVLGKGTVEELIEKIYKKTQDKSTFDEEYVGNILQLFDSPIGETLLVTNNLGGQIKQNFNRLREKLFVGSRWGLEKFAPKLDINDGASLMQFLSRMSTSWGKGGYNKKMVDRLVEKFKDIKISPNGKYTTSKKDGIVLNASKGAVAEQLRIKLQLGKLAKGVSKNKITVKDYNDQRAPLMKRWEEIIGDIRAGKVVKTEEDLLQEQSDRVQEIYENKKLSLQNRKNKIVAEMEAFVQKTANKYWRGKEWEESQKEQAYTKADFIQDLRAEVLKLTYPAPGKRIEKETGEKKLLKAYDQIENPNIPLTQYIMQNLGHRAGGEGGILDRGLDVNKPKVGLEKAREIEGDAGYTGEVAEIGKGVYLADALKSAKDLQAVTGTHLKGIIDSFKNSPWILDGTVNFAKLFDLSPELTKKMFGVAYKTKDGKRILKNGKPVVDGPKTIQKQAEFIAENWRVIYNALPKGAMLKTGIPEIEGLSTLVKGILMDGVLYGKTTRKGKKALATAKKTGKKAGLKVQKKILLPKENAQEWFLDRLGIDVVYKTKDGEKILENGKLVIDKVITSRIKSQVRKSTDISSARINGIIAEIGRMITNQTVRRHMEESTEKRKPILENIERINEDLNTLERKRESLGKENKSTFEVDNKIEKLLNEKESELNKLDKEREESGIPQQFEVKDNINRFINSVRAGKAEGTAAKGEVSEILLSKLKKDLVDNKDPVTYGSLMTLLTSEEFKREGIGMNHPFVKELAEIIRIAETGKGNLDVQIKALIKEGKFEQEVLERTRYNDIVKQLKENKVLTKLVPELKNILEEGSKDWRKNTDEYKDFMDVMGEVASLYPDGIPKKFHTLILRTLGQGVRGGQQYHGKNKNGEEIWTNIKHPEGKTGDFPTMYKIITGKKWKPSTKNLSAKMRKALKHVSIVNMGTFKTDLAKWMLESVNSSGKMTRSNVDIYNYARNYLTKGSEASKAANKKNAKKGLKASTLEEVIEANRTLREFHLTGLRNIIKKAKPGEARTKAIKAVMRHLRMQTEIGEGIIKGTATTTSVSSILGIKDPTAVKKRPKSKTIEGTRFRGEHQLQLLNHTAMFLDTVFRTLNNKTQFKKELGVLSKLFEQAITRFEDMQVYDSPLHGGKTGFVDWFKKHPLGAVSSIANIMYRPGISFEMIDLTSKIPGQTIGERLMDKYSKKQILEVINLVRRNNPEVITVETVKFESNVKNKESNKIVKEDNAKQLEKVTGYKASKGETNKELINKLKNVDKALSEGRKMYKKKRGLSTFDFDETVGVSENYIIATKGKETRKIASKDWPVVGEQLRAEGWKLDFTDFNKVTEGKPGPLMQKLKNQIKKFGNENVFILTARAPESATAIHEWLKSEGVNIPLKNITGLGNSTGEAKAMWMLEKFSEGYNDMYFVDDAISNVKAVKHVLDQLDIKSKVQQARAAKGDLNKQLNAILEHSLDIGSKKRFSTAEGKMRGSDKKRRKFFIPDSAADLELLIEPLLGRGKKGIENRKWFIKNFHKPFERGINDLNNARQAILNDYMALRKQNKGVVKSLDKPIEGTSFTVDQAARVYIWNKAGFEVPGLTKTSKDKLLKHVANNPKLQAYAESVANLTKIETGLKKPSEYWWGETLATEVSETGRTIGRDKYIKDWIEAKNEIFSEENLAKMESELGPRWREAMDGMLYRMESGRMRAENLDRLSNEVMDYLNGATGAIMHLNTRSAFLQLISTVNFINHGENNPFAAAKAFANQPQYWKDFMHIMNSPMLKQRRAGLQINVSEAELALAASSGKKGFYESSKRVLATILKHGYLPTKIADSFAIASGGATYYRNRIKMYERQGLKTKEAERKAWIDFQAIAEKTQQSSRPDLLSQQQVSVAGRLVLPFGNTPMQMNRIGMKELLDISKGRYEGFYGENSLTHKMNKISYYWAVQSAIFAGLQSAAFAMWTMSDDEPLLAKKKVRAANTMADSFLRGMGISGAVLAGFKNAVMKFAEQNKKGYRGDFSEVGEALLNISPTIGSKFSGTDASGNTYKYNKKSILQKGFSLDNTSGLEAVAQTIQSITNAPTYNYFKKSRNIQSALDEQNAMWQRAHNFMGYSPYDVGAADYQKKKSRKKNAPVGW